ncbi:similar to Saccharomyces cerevisiae YLR443W ECM7 Non-essential putative integral membrane protein with a role in calcium uptake [Maudiozyma saulgeensis]|uniref:Similar to Saccharomyces cerevisiae YLR443W ECM7 Non-essential putative integral membrane protein with a role in calcium uptake n=1 Tax=Maudiozyma saulgeensis TaxID=1789683 RepID=A0A1X7R8G5_9SACH|nr:similar to Saccharomyces cerevisiae YLR443W ECM7 Non-essential putative integral membrane protein with a role in calcium uptake [Kazachstania saulgeensis]
MLFDGQHGLLQPYKNLTMFERWVFWVRILSMMFCIAFSITIVLGPLTLPDRLYMSRLNTYSSEITEGIFRALSDAMESGASSTVNNGVGLTSAELYILTAYSSAQVSNVPQYITISLYGTCYTYYTTIDDSADGLYSYQDTKTTDSPSHSQRNSTVILECFKEGFDYVLDYREILTTLGLDIVLDYAYGETDSSGSMRTSAYEGYIRIMKLNKKQYLTLFIVVIFFQIIAFVFTFWYYSIKGRYINTVREKTLLHIITFLSFCVFVMGLVSLMDLVWLNYSFQKKIKGELMSFGFEYKLGLSYFVCLWMVVFLISISCMAWSGLEWCVSDSTVVDDAFLSENGVGAAMIDSTNNRALLDEASQSDLEENRMDGFDTDGYEDDKEADFLRSSNLKEAFQNSRRFGKRISHRQNNNHNGDESDGDNDDLSDFDELHDFNTYRGRYHAGHDSTHYPGGYSGDIDLDEAYEMQSITLRSSTDSDAMRQQTIVPSSTMMF